MAEKPFKGTNIGTGKIVFTDKLVNEGMPIEIFFKEDGTIDDKPSLAILLKMSNDTHVIGQISLDMFNEGLVDIGYKMVKLEETKSNQ